MRMRIGDDGAFIAEFITKAYIAPIDLHHGFSGRRGRRGRWLAYLTDRVLAEMPLLDNTTKKSDPVVVEPPYSNLVLGRLFCHGILRSPPDEAPNLQIRLRAGTEGFGWLKLHGRICVRPPALKLAKSHAEAVTIPPISENRWEFTVFGVPNPALEWTFSVSYHTRVCKRIWHRIAVTYHPTDNGDPPTVDVEFLGRSAFPSHCLWLGPFTNLADFNLKQEEFSRLWEEAPPPASLPPFAADELPLFVREPGVVDGTIAL